MFVELPKEKRILTGNPDLYGFWMAGHWTECSNHRGEDPIDDCADLGGQIEDKVEYSWLFTRRPSISSEQWLQAGAALADQHRQDAFVIALDGNVSVRKQDGWVYRELADANPSTVSNEWEHLARLRGGAASSDYIGLRSAPRPSRVQADGREPGEPDETTGTPGAQSAGSSYSFSGPGLPSAAEFRMAEPGSNSSSMWFYHVGAHRMLSQGVPRVSAAAKPAL